MTLMRRNSQGFLTHPEPRTSSGAHRRDLWCPQDWPITAVYSLIWNITQLTVIWLEFCLQEKEECLSGDNIPGVGDPKCFTNSVVPSSVRMTCVSADVLFSKLCQMSIGNMYIRAKPVWKKEKMPRSRHTLMVKLALKVNKQNSDKLKQNLERIKYIFGALRSEWSWH